MLCSGIHNPKVEVVCLRQVRSFSLMPWPWMYIPTHRLHSSTYMIDMSFLVHPFPRTGAF